MPRAEDLAPAIERAIRFFADSREPHALLWLELMHRRFGVEAFAGSLEGFDRVLAEGPENAALLRVFRRIAEPGHVVEQPDLAAVSHPSDQMIVAALYCDQLGLPPFFPEELARAVDNGGYYCTHALLAFV
ncbi:MAG: hypothetical protein R3305_03550, partial [Gammaproteobacteria bacterium]|nr:hypothetical protein [Gammaproteobacteria bacterium]